MRFWMMEVRIFSRAVPNVGSRRVVTLRKVRVGQSAEPQILKICQCGFESRRAYFARVAQLAEAPDSNSGGWKFESSHGQ